MRSLRAFTALACLLLLGTVWLLPLPAATRLGITVVLVLCGVFVLVDSTGKGRTFAAITVALLVLYLGVTAQRGVLLVRGDGGIPGILLGVGMILLPALGAWALVREVLFGVRVQRLGQRLGEEGGLPEQPPRTASGRIDREAADAAFPARRAEVEEAPQDWRTWFRLALAYDAAGDRKRARRAMRDAVALDRGRPAHHLADGEG